MLALAGREQFLSSLSHTEELQTVSVKFYSVKHISWRRELKARSSGSKSP